MKIKKIRKLFLSGILISSMCVNVMASTLSEGGRYESFEGNKIVISNMLEEDEADVEVEGNTRTNLVDITYMFARNNAQINESDLNNNSFTVTYLNEATQNGGSNRVVLDNYFTRYVKPNTKYTVMYEYELLDNPYNEDCMLSIAVDMWARYVASTPVIREVGSKGVVINTISSGSDVSNYGPYLNFYNDIGRNTKWKVSNIMVYEGEYTTDKIDFHKGLKSVGEKEDGTASLGIKSLPGNDNLIVNSDFKVTATKDREAEIKDLELSPDIKPKDLIGKELTLSFDVHTPGEGKNNANRPLYGNEIESRFGMHITAHWRKSTDTSLDKVEYYLIAIRNTNIKNKRVSVSQILEPPDGYDTLKRISIAFQPYRMPADDNNEEWYLARPKLEIGKEATPWVPNYNEDSYNDYIKKIELSEPLRSLPDGTKDRIIKKNGQWVVERKIAEVILDGSDDESWRDNFTGYEYCTTKRYLSAGVIDDGSLNDSYAGRDVIISNKYPWIGGWSNTAKFGISRTGNSIFLYDINLANTTELLNSLNDNPVKILYKTNDTVCEPLNVDSSVKIFEKTTYITNDSIIPANMKVTVDRVANRAKEAVELAEITPTVENLAQARYWSNLMKESILKDNFQDSINMNTDIEDLIIEKKTVGSNADIYIRMKNSLSLSLDTNSIVFEDVDSTQGMELKNAVNLTVKSSLPYDIKASMESELYNKDKSNKLDKSVLNIKNSGSNTYQGFGEIGVPILLLENQDVADIKTHSVDLKLDVKSFKKADVYKTTLKFQVEQK